jgi:hypothetical protein
MEEVIPVFEVGERIPDKQYSTYRSVYPIYRRTPGVEPAFSDLWGFLACQKGWGKTFRVMPVRKAEPGQSGYFEGFAPNHGYSNSIWVSHRDDVLKDIEFSRVNDPARFSKFQTVREMEIHEREQNAKIRAGKEKFLRTLKEREERTYEELKILSEIYVKPDMSAEKRAGLLRVIERISAELVSINESVKKQEADLASSKD